MLEAYAEIDKALADLNGNSAAWRQSEELPHIEGSFVFADWGYGTVWALMMDPASGMPVRRGVLHRKDPEHKFNPTLVTADASGEPVILSQEGSLYRLEEDKD